VWFKTMKLEKRASAVRGGPDQETLVIEGYAWATDSDDTPSMIHTAMKFVSNLQQPRVNFSEFFVGAPEMGKLSDGPLRARSGGGASIVDGPTRALSFSVKMPLKNRAVAPVPVAP
jgi:hypothetical protein